MMRLVRAVPTGSVVVVMTEAADGDLAVGGVADVLSRRRRGLTGSDWSWLHQVHGDAVVEVSDTAVEGMRADALVTRRADAHLAVHTADCVPVALIADSGAVGVVHAGWRGLTAGVVGRAVDALGADDARVGAIIGPCIHPCCYEFGVDDLDQVAARLGDGVRGRTLGGAAALDLLAATHATLADARVDDRIVVDRCTACDDRLFSHRARGDTGRQAMVVWREARS